jgi:putative methanogenesis marker protein 8
MTPWCIDRCRELYLNVNAAAIYYKVNSMAGDEHIIEAIGRCRIVIRDGKVVEVGPPAISSCPLAERFAKPVREITSEAVRENIQARIQEFGMCTPDRAVYAEGEFVGFGASELTGNGLLHGVLDCAVLASDGAGTVLATTPGLVQGIGGRMSGLVKTIPIPDVIDRIEKNGGMVLDRTGGRIDQLAGTRLAYARGYRLVAVTIATAETAEEIRREFPEALIIAVHTTGTTPEEAERLARSADLITACASAHVRSVAGKRALLQAGTAIPVFAMTQRGKDLILSKVRWTKDQVLVQGAKLPYAGERQPKPLV